MAERRCPDCETVWGELHERFCTKELCPFCGGQLASCECIFAVLQLTDAEREVVEEYIDDSEQPLQGINERWVAALEAKGRIPFGPPSVG